MKLNVINWNEAQRYAENPNFRFIDLRDYKQYKVSHFYNAYHMPYQETINYNQLDKNKKYIFYCDRGGISAIVAREALKRGYTAYTVLGGYHAYNGKFKIEAKR